MRGVPAGGQHQMWRDRLRPAISRSTPILVLSSDVTNLCRSDCSRSMAASNSNDKMSSPHDEQCSQVVSEMTIVPPGIFGGGSNRYVPCVSSSEFSPQIGHCLVAMFFPSTNFRRSVIHMTRNHQQRFLRLA